MNIRYVFDLFFSVRNDSITDEKKNYDTKKKKHSIARYLSFD
jgi:hypothetical protein